MRVGVAKVKAMAPELLRALTLPLALLCLSSAWGAEARDKREGAAVAYVKKQQADAEALLEQVANINSGTMNFDGVRAVGAVFQTKFAALGFKTRWVDGKPFGRAGHLIAEHRPAGSHEQDSHNQHRRKAPRVLLIGHLDTVFEPGSPFQRFERVDAHIARGPGTADMKGGIIIALHALGALREVGALDAMDITVVLHGDEEDSGAPLAAARTDLIEAAKYADIAIGLENAADDPSTAVTARRSSSQWQVKVTARSAHSSQIFTDAVGAGAAYELARILNAFYTELRGEEFLTFNPGLMIAGAQVEFDAEPLQAEGSGKNNIIAPVAMASGDLRAISMEQYRRTQERMRKIVAASLPGTRAEIAFDDNYPPLSPTEGNTRLLGIYDAVSRDLGYGPVTAVNPRRAGAADISFTSGHVDMAIDGLGWLGGKSHTPDEFVDLRNFQIQAQRLAVLLLRLK